MEVILLQDVDKLGNRGQIVKVANGYARNFLLTKKLAVAATAQNRKWVEQQRIKFLKLEANEKAEATELAKLIQAAATVVVRRKSGEKGTLFGSVTSKDVAEGLAEQGFNIDRRRVQLDAPLKLLGEYDVPIRLHREVTATVKVRIESEGEPEAAPQPQE